nr:META domain-containing protein [Caulobacter sp. 17J65-9]
MPLLALLFAPALSGCTNAQATPPADPLTAAEWRLQDMNARGLVDASAVTLRFDADGRASGRGGCNRWSGAWRREGVGDGLTLSELGSTRNACAAAVTHQENVFLSALQETTGYRIAAGGVLLLTTRDGRQLTFAPVTD